MCLLLSFSCCGGSCTSSPKLSRRQSKKLDPVQEQPIQQQPAPIQQQQPIQQQPTPINYHSDLQLNDMTRSEFHMSNSQGKGSMLSLPMSMSTSLMPLPHPMTNSSTLSSWAGEEELYDMDEYEERMPTRWTPWWLRGDSASDLNQKGFEI